VGTMEAIASGYQPRSGVKGGAIWGAAMPSGRRSIGSRFVATLSCFSNVYEFMNIVNHNKI